MKSHIYLIRHGQTAWSVSGQHTGLTDIPLTPQGEEEALQCAARLKGVRFDRVITSPLRRARRTSEIVCPGVASTVDKRLVEWNYGQYDSLLLRQIHEKRPDWNVFLHGAPGGDSVADVERRADSMISDLKAFSGTTAVFSHGHFLRSLSCRWLGRPISDGRNLVLGTAAISVLGVTEKGEAKLVLWNSLPVLPSLSKE